MLGRREFVKVAAGAGLALGATAGLGIQPSLNDADGYRLVARTDRERILRAAQEYLVLKPVTITAFPADRSAGGLHDYFS